MLKIDHNITGVFVIIKSPIKTHFLMEIFFSSNSKGEGNLLKLCVRTLDKTANTAFRYTYDIFGCTK
jgi:hypothetical protein